jgi:mRNA interferase RelE/StbE
VYTILGTLIPQPAALTILRALAPLGDNPRRPDANIKRLAGYEDRYRLRVGDYRIIYEVMDEQIVILVVGVGRRREIRTGSTFARGRAARNLTIEITVDLRTRPGSEPARTGRPLAAVMEVACASALVMCPCGSTYPGRPSSRRGTRRWSGRYWWPSTAAPAWIT